MTREPSHQDVRTLWRNQEMESYPFSLEEIRSQARRFQSQVRWRNLREYLASVVVVVVFGYFFFIMDDALLRLAAALTIAGVLYVCYQLQKRGSARKLPAEPALRTCLEFHRTELVQQRDLLRDVWRWYLLPFVPGFSLFLASQVMQAPWTRWGILLVWFVILFVGIGMLNQWAARRLQREIEALEKES